MKSITTLAVLSLIGIIGSLLTLNYYVNFYKPRHTAVQTSIELPKDSIKSIPDLVVPAVTTPVTATPIAAEKHSTPSVVPTTSTGAKSATTHPTAPKQAAPVPKSADVAVKPPVKPVLPAKVVPKTVAPDAGITAKGADATVEMGMTKGLHYVIIGSFADENNAKVAMHNYPLKNLSIHKDGKFYRLSAGAFATTAEAKRRMNELQRQSVESILIQH
jgi:cell division protein FtsN